MKVEEILEANPSEPIINIVPINDLQSYLYLHDRIRHGRASVDLVKEHKLKLGKQKYCWTGEFKFWIWEIPMSILYGDIYFLRVFVSNQKGISIEVAGGIKDVWQIKDAFQKYYEVITK